MESDAILSQPPRSCNENVGVSQIERQQDSSLIQPSNLQDDDNYYLSNYKIPGYVLIFNHVNFVEKSGQKTRQGSERDTANLLETFTALNFECHVHNDLTLSEIKSQIEEVNKQQFSDYGSIVVSILSHGDRNGIIWAKDEHYHTSDVWEPFIKNESLQNKPKIFIFQACRGSHKQSVRGNIEGEKIGTKALTWNYIQNLKGICKCQNVPRLPHSPDVLVAYSTVEHCESIRHIEDGTWYVQTLCTELKLLQQRNIDLVSMFTNVAKVLVEENCGEESKELTFGQTPTFVSFLKNNIYLRNDTSPCNSTLEYDWSQYKWRGQARIYFDNDHEQEAKSFAETLKDLDFTPVVRKIDCPETYIDDVNKLEDNFYNEGCILIAVLAKYDEDQHYNKYLPKLINSASLSFQEQRATLAGKPKMIFFYDKQMETPTEMMQTDAIFRPKYATQHSDFLIVRGFKKEFLNIFISHLKCKSNIIDCVTKTVAATSTNISRYKPHFESTLRANVHFNNTIEAVPIEFVQDTTESCCNTGINLLLQQRNVDGYIERQYQLSQIKSAMFSKERGRLVDIVIAGMPGVGKSQLALSYAKNSRHMYKNIIWLDATNEDSLRHHFSLIGKKCNITQNDQNQDYLIREIYKYLNSSNTLILFDNANPEMIKHVPQNTTEYDKLYFVFTSTYTDWGTTGESKVKKVIILDKFTEDETKEFLTQKFQTMDYDAEDIKNLGEAVDNFPLSLQLASAYIFESAKALTENPIKRYIEAISAIENSPNEVQTHLSKLEKVWQPTLEKIKVLKSGKIAKSVLKIISYFEPNNIPVHLFFQIKEGTKKLRILNALEDLKKYCIITSNFGKINIHKLLQNLIRSRIENQAKTKNYIERGMKIINDHINNIKIKTGTLNLPNDCSLHSVKLIRYALKYPDIVATFPNVPSCTVLKLNFEFNSKLAADLGEEVQSIFDTVDGLAFHSLELKAMRSESKIRLGLYNEALEELNHLIDTNNWTVKNALNIALLCHNKAMVLHKLGKLEESVNLHRDVFNGLNKILKKDDHRLLASKQNLAVVLTELEKYDEALDILYDNLEMIDIADNRFRAKVDRLLNQTEISKIYRSMGLFHESKIMIDEAIEELENQVTSKSPLVLSEKHNRNLLLDNLGVKTSEIISDCLEIYETKCEVLGKQHISTQQTGARIAALYNRTNSAHEAQELFNEVIQSLEKSLGKNHATVLTIKHNATLGIERSGNFFNAFHSYLTIYTIQCESLGIEHNSTLETRERMAYCLYMLKQAKSALEIYDEVIKLRIKKWGEHHPDLQFTRHNRAMVLNLMEKNDEALIEFNEIVSLDEEMYGIDHIMTLRTKERIANVLRETGNLVESKRLFDEILPKLKSNLGSQHDDVICARVNRARVLDDMGKRLSAIKIYSRCKDILCDKYGMSHYLTKIVEDLYCCLHDTIFDNVTNESDTDDGDISDDYVYPHQNE